VLLALITLGALVMIQPEAAGAAAPTVQASPDLEKDALREPLVGDAFVVAGATVEPGEARRRPGTMSEALSVNAAAATEASALASVPTPELGSALQATPPNVKVWDRLPPLSKRVFGISLALVSGWLSGNTFTAPQYVVDRTAAWQAHGRSGPPPFPGASTHLIDLLFSHFTGVFFISTAAFVVYAAATRNRPQVFAETSLPAFGAGCVWALGMVACFVANADLSLVIAFVS
jgi:hypothetical protein